MPILATFEPKPARLEDVVTTADADYGIFWQFSSQGNVLEPAVYYSVDTMIMERSRAYTFPPEVDAVGKCWQSKQPRFMQDVAEQDIGDYVRQDLASYFGIRSVAMVPFSNGVLEFGTHRLWQVAPNWDSRVLRASRKMSSMGASLPRFDASQEKLLEVIRTTNAAYGIFWVHYKAVDELKCSFFAALDGKLMRKSVAYTFERNKDEVGQCYVSQKMRFVRDASALDADAFRRKSLAAYHGVHSIVFLPFENGILEIGTTATWEAPPPFDKLNGSRPARAVGEEDGAAEENSPRPSTSGFPESHHLEDQLTPRIEAGEDEVDGFNSGPPASD